MWTSICIHVSLYTMQIVKTINGNSKITYNYFEFALLLRQAFKRIGKSMDKDVAKLVGRRASSHTASQAIIHIIMELKWVRWDLYPHLSNCDGTNCLLCQKWDATKRQAKLDGTKSPPMSKMAWDQLSVGIIVLQWIVPQFLNLHPKMAKYIV